MCLLIIEVAIYILQFYQILLELLKIIPQSTRCSENTTPLKEVIQPHVLVRLPCYDFTPVIRIALDASLPCGLGQRFQALRTPMV